MTAYSTGEARDAIAGLAGTGGLVPLTDPVLVAEVVLAHYLDVAGQVARRHRKHREDEHGDERRDAIRGLAAHLPKHAARRAA